jgi:oligopeptide transport system substrate-binding protein
MFLAPLLKSVFARAAVGLAAALALSGCQQKAQRPACPADQVCLEYGNGTEPETLDPQKSSLLDESVIINDLMHGLTTEAPDGSVAPALAQSWTTSPDGLVWTFKLRPARWSDGVPVTADDFVYAYRRVLEPETAAIYAYLVASMFKNGQAVNAGKAPPEALGVRALGPRTLEITLEHPAPYLPELLKHLSFFPVPKHVVEKYGDQWVQPGHYVSTGPYQLVAWRLGDYIQVRKNPRFWDAASVCVDRINYYPTADVVAAERRVARGELDINTSFQSNRITRLRKTMPGYVRTHVTLATSYMVFNASGASKFRDIRVRRALSEAVDREFIANKLLRAGQVPAYSFVPPAIANYVKGPRLKWAGRSLAERQADARRLLAEAGYGPDNPLKLEIKTSNATESQLMAQSIQADWRAVGVEAALVQNEFQVAMAAYRTRDFDVAPIAWIADYNDPLTFLELVKSDTGAQNYGDYKNPAYDALLAQAAAEPDRVARAHILARAEQIMLDDEALAPLLFGVNRNLVSPRVTGWVDNAANQHRARWLCVTDRKPAPPAQ